MNRSPRFSLLILTGLLLGPAALAGETVRSAKPTSDSALCYTRQDLAARAAGFIDKVHVQDGATVKAGDLLIEMDHRLLATAVKEAEAGVRAARAQVSLAEDAFARLKKLTDSASQQEVFSAEVKVEQAKAQLAQAQAILERHRINLSDAMIRATIGGQVSGLPRVKGLFVQAGQSLGRVEGSPGACAANNQ